MVADREGRQHQGGVSAVTQDHTPVSRLPADLPDDPIITDLFARVAAHHGRVLNIHRAVGHAPKILRAQASYAGALREESSLPRTLQVLLVLRTAQVNGSPYEPSVHRGAALRLGVSAAKLDALASWRSSPLFDARECAALGFVDQMADRGEVDDATFAETAKAFTAQEIVELAAVVAWYAGNARFVRALRIAPES
jgi:AhpD family alkylhydroperoxidase